LGKRSVVTLAAAGDRLVAATARQGIAADPSGAPLPNEDFGAVSFSLTGGRAQPLWDSRPRVSTMCSFQRPGQPPTMAVGLRDGQVYLWREGDGRETLLASSRRPLYRPVTFLWYDARLDRLFAGDTQGVVAEFQLGAEGLVSMRTGQLPEPGAVRSLRVSPRNELLVVQEHVEGPQVAVCPLAELEELDKRIEAEQSQFNRLGPAAKQAFQWAYSPTQDLDDVKIADATLNAEGDTLVVLAGERLYSKPLGGGGWSPAPAGQRLAASMNRGELLARLRCLPDGKVLTYGPGVVRMLTGLGADGEVAFRVRSRAPVELVTESPAEHGLAALTVQGRVIEWNDESRKTDQQLKQFLLTRPGDVVVSCDGPQPGQAYVARRSPPGAAVVVELRDLAEDKVLKQVCRVDQGSLRAMCAEQGWVAMLIQEEGEGRVEVYSPTGQRSTAPVTDHHFSDAETPIQIALGAQGSKFAMVTHYKKEKDATSPDRFSAYYAERDHDGAWGPLRFVQE
ncbi:MAG: hypothetical protein KDA37_13025, partial [Planctomycetales bacterium]|nr:hypothetical protein [Planctomycetales bacterium]